VKELYESDNPRKVRLQSLYCQPFYLLRLLAYYYKNKTIPENPALLLQFSIDQAFAREVQAWSMTCQEVDNLKSG
jgi:hypothetical protein